MTDADLIREGIEADSGYPTDPALDALDRLLARLEAAERQRESLHHELVGLEHMRIKDNAALIGERDAALARAEAAEGGLTVCDASWQFERARVVRLEAALREITRLEWTHDVDVNGEYVTEKWRDSFELKWEIDKIVDALAAVPADPEAALADPSRWFVPGYGFRVKQPGKPGHSEQEASP